MRRKPARSEVTDQPQLHADNTSARMRNSGFGEDEAPPSQLQDDNRRLRQQQLEIAREQGLRRRAPAHRSRGPEDEVRNQRRPKN